MKLSRKWLQEFVDLSDVGDRAFADAMTLSGSKVEGTEVLNDSFKNVVAGRVVSMERHPDSDHMWICQTDVGRAEPVQIVTGAWNVHTGDFVPVALHGAVLPDGKKIERGKLRGVLSEGMFCSLKELGLTVEHDYPEAVIIPAALLNDYHPLNPDKPSVPEDVQPGTKLYGTVIAARVASVERYTYGCWRCTLNVGTDELEMDESRFQNIHVGDYVAWDTETHNICSLSDLHAKQSEFPHCITDGIWILPGGRVPGEDIAAFVGADDHVVEFEITPNRPDCLSVIGLAREASATFRKPLTLHAPEIRADGGGNIAELLDIEIEDGVLCPRYTARLVKNVKIRPSPDWMRQRLRNSGIRPINNIVDITNYVMLEYGQPMHAFDFSCVDGGKIIVRTARDGESIQTLDGTVRALTPDMLCICDVEKPVCVAGVMGGANSEIIGDTAMVLFESANFNGASVRRTAVALNMRTEASARYEKGLDPMNTFRAVQRACELVEQLGAGEVVEGLLDVIAADRPAVTVRLEPDKINRLLGTDVPADEMRRILRSLDFELDGDEVRVPSWRGDVEHYSDLAEEVARFYGYTAIPDTLSSGLNVRRGFNRTQKMERLVGQVSRSCGYSEIITYSFISPSCYDKIRLPENSPLRDSLKILNPLGEDRSIMRTTVLPSMLETLTRNWNYRNKSVKLYELGRTYFPRPDGLADEPKTLCFGAYGDDMDFFTLKGAVQAILDALRVDGVRYAAVTDNPSYHPGRCAEVRAGDTRLGVLGQVHPAVADAYGVDAEYYVAELSFDALCGCAGAEPVYQPLPRFPSVPRDIALVCDRTTPVAALQDAICKSGADLLKSVALFDVYTGPGIPPDKKSVAFNLTFRSDERSLTAAEVDEAVSRMLERLKAELNAVLR